MNVPANQKEKPAWIQAMSEGVSDPVELLSLVGLDPADVPYEVDTSTSFTTRVPMDFVSRMRENDPNDPLLLQVLPIKEERKEPEGFSSDPLHEKAASSRPGLLHKYRGRVLIIVTSACGVHCRYCFRRHFPYEDHALGGEEWESNLNYIKQNESIDEVIFSGGDPLSLLDSKLSQLARDVSSIPHITKLRLHTRMPVVLPERVNEKFIKWFTSGDTQPVLVIHANHPSEINEKVADAMDRLKQAGVTLLNQSVLLRDINDSVDVLQRLSEKLFEAGVLPYYLHVLDPVQGAAHFDVPDEEAKELVQEVAAGIPGYLVPRLVREVPGEPSKVHLSWQD